MANNEITTEIAEDGLSARLTGTPLHLFADMIFQVFIDNGVENHLECKFQHEDSGEEFVLLMQKKSGLTQGEKNSVLQERIEQLEMALKSNMELFEMLNGETHPSIELDAVAHSIKQLLEQ